MVHVHAIIKVRQLERISKVPRWLGLAVQPCRRGCIEALGWVVLFIVDRFDLL